MGLLDKILSRTPDYPELEQSSREYKQLDEHRADIEKITKEVTENIEVVLSDSGFFVLIGKPPSNFGFEWVENNELRNFKSLVEAKKVNPIRMERIVDRLSDAYKASKDAPRFKASVGEHEVVITRSDDLAAALKQEIDKLSA
ncbi:MAG: hypothetical protein R3174_03200 [Gammaproteobacteria bacterium]|nr:hypothetical protein [Gammaproteobacteria bacterium]